MLCDAAVMTLAEGGLRALSISSMARRIGVSPPALTQRWRGPRGARARILQLVVHRFGERWHWWSRGPLIEDPPSLALPATDDELEGVRVWLALRELARSEHAAGNPDVALAVAQIGALDRAEIGDKVRCRGGGRVASGAVVGICALADGLRIELVASEPAIQLATAEDLLRTHIAVVRGAWA